MAESSQSRLQIRMLKANRSRSVDVSPATAAALVTF
jgi:hypothetical protein